MMNQMNRHRRMRTFHKRMKKRAMPKVDRLDVAIMLITETIM